MTGIAPLVSLKSVFIPLTISVRKNKKAAGFSSGFFSINPEKSGRLFERLGSDYDRFVALSTAAGIDDPDADDFRNNPA